MDLAVGDLAALGELGLEVADLLGGLADGLAGLDLGFGFSVLAADGEGGQGKARANNEVGRGVMRKVLGA